MPVLCCVSPIKEENLIMILTFSVAVIGCTMVGIIDRITILDRTFCVSVAVIGQHYLAYVQQTHVLLQLKLGCWHV